MLQSLVDWLSGTSLSGSLQTITWAIPAIQSVHILALGGLMGAAWLLGWRLMGWSASVQPAARMAARLVPWIWVSLGVLALSGALLIVAEPAELLFSPVFQLKMLLLASAAILTVAVRRRLGDPKLANDAAAVPSTGMRAAALLFLTLWTAIAVAGRFIAYV